LKVENGYVDFVVGRFTARAENEGLHIARLNRIEEEGPVIADRRNVEGVVALEGRRVRRQQ
jgi:hypothetical protein